MHCICWPRDSKPHAQAKPKAYVISEVTVIDPVGLKSYAERAGPLIKQHGGTFLVRNEKGTAIDGDAPKQYTIYVFDSLEAEQAWQNDPAVKALLVERRKYATFRAFVVEGRSSLPQ
jgi:uncharacterized protein (DUF1330 family)